MKKSTFIMKNRLVEHIEAQLSWGKGDTWSNKDFEELSALIFKVTNKRLSVTTLKRIWGRAASVANPSTATLDILSEFSGFDNWRNFLQSHEPLPAQNTVLKKGGRSPFRIGIAGLLVLLSLFALFWYAAWHEKKTAPYNSSDFSFTSRRVSIGIPNSVVFEYDASAARENARIEIQQDWDNSKRTEVNKNDSIATSIYYRPGFFKSKLVVDGEIVGESDVFIPTQDWLGVIEQEPHPIYLNNRDIIKENRLAITPEVLTKHNLDPSTSKVAVGFYQMRDFGELYTDSFEMSVSVKNDFNEGISACQFTQVAILYDGGALTVAMGNKGCSSELGLIIFDKMVDGKKTDLSGFGVDFTDYVNLKCVSKNQKLDILVNDTSAYQTEVPELSKKILGMTIHFEGAGSIKNVALKNDHEVVYSSHYDTPAGSTHQK